MTWLENKLGGFNYNLWGLVLQEILILLMNLIDSKLGQPSEMEEVRVVVKCQHRYRIA